MRFALASSVFVALLTGCGDDPADTDTDTDTEAPPAVSAAGAWSGSCDIDGDEELGVLLDLMDDGSGAVGGAVVFTNSTDDDEVHGTVEGLWTDDALSLWFTYTTGGFALPELQVSIDGDTMTGAMVTSDADPTTPGDQALNWPCTLTRQSARR